MSKTSRTKKALLIEEFRENPFVTRACSKFKIARSTYYRWCLKDLTFKFESEVARDQGRAKLNDFVESKLLANIKENNQQAISFWLRANHEIYRPQTLRVVIEENKQQRIELTSLQAMLEELIRLKGVDALIESAVPDPKAFKKKFEKDLQQQRKRLDKL